MRTHRPTSIGRVARLWLLQSDICGVYAVYFHYKAPRALEPLFDTKSDPYICQSLLAGTQERHFYLARIVD